MQFHLQIRIDIGNIDDFHIDATKTEIKDNIPDIPPKSVDDLKCPNDEYSMTCALKWQGVSMICLVLLIILSFFLQSSEIDL